MKGVIFLLSLVLFLCGCTTHPPEHKASGNCIEVRLVMDLGSGAFKSKAARYDVCAKRIVESLWSDSIKTSFREDLATASDQKISVNAQARGKKVVSNWVGKIRHLDPKARIFGFATAVFRNAKNGSMILENWSQEYLIPLQVITQETEGYWAYQAFARNVFTDQTITHLVWDIGGGSQQWTWKDTELRVVKSELASVTFKNAIFETLKETVSFPFPRRGEKIGLQLAKKESSLLIPQFSQLDRKRLKVWGVGGVWSQSLKPAINSQRKITQEALENLFKKRKKMQRSEFQSEYFETETTNVLLVKSLMNQLGFNEVHVSPETPDAMDFVLAHWPIKVM